MLSICCVFQSISSISFLVQSMIPAPYLICYSSQDAVFRVIEQCRRTLDKSGKVRMVLMDLSKAYDLLLAKHEAYGFSLDSLKR